LKKISGTKNIRVDFQERSGNASVKLDLEKISESEESKPPRKFEYLPGRLIVSWGGKELFGNSDLKKVKEVTGVKNVDYTNVFDDTVILDFETEFFNQAQENFETEEVKNVDDETKQIKETLGKIQEIKSVDLNGIFDSNFTPDDTNFVDQWFLNNTGQTMTGRDHDSGTTGLNDADVDAAEAWDIETGSTNQIIVAVIDGGVDVNHPDLTNNILRDAGGIVGYDFVDDDDLYPVGGVFPDWGHGTHVAGLIAAEGNNAQGISGVCPECKIMPIRVLGAGGGSWADLALSIQYAVDNGADIINMSLGAASAPSSIQDVINNAYAQGVTLVAAAGNSFNYGSEYPAAFDNIISVASSTNEDQKSSFSTYHETVDVLSPGSDTLSTLPAGAFLADYCSDQNHGTDSDGYGYCSGTSMASPVDAGVAGLILAKDPSLTPAEVEIILEATSDKIAVTQTGQYAGLLGAGRVNAYNAVNFNGGHLLLSDHTFDDLNGNSNQVFEPGEDMNLNFEVTSLLGDSTNVEVEVLSVEDGSFTTSLFNLGDILADQIANDTFAFKIDNTATSGTKKISLKITNNEGNELLQDVFFDVNSIVDLTNADWTFDTDGEGFVTEGNGWYHTTQDCGISGNPGYWHFGVSDCNDYSNSRVN